VKKTHPNPPCEGGRIDPSSPSQPPQGEEKPSGWLLSPPWGSWRGLGLFSLFSTLIYIKIECLQEEKRRKRTESGIILVILQAKFAACT